MDEKRLDAYNISKTDFRQFLDLCDLVLSKTQVAIMDDYFIHDMPIDKVASSHFATKSQVRYTIVHTIKKYKRYKSTGLILSDTAYNTLLSHNKKDVIYGLSSRVLSLDDRLNKAEFGTELTDRALVQLNWNFRRLGLPEVVYVLSEKEAVSRNKFKYHLCAQTE